MLINICNHSVHGKRSLVAKFTGSVSNTTEERKKLFRRKPAHKENSMAILQGNVIHEEIYLLSQVLK